MIPTLNHESAFRWFSKFYLHFYYSWLYSLQVISYSI